MNEHNYKVEGNIIRPDKTMLSWGPFYYHSQEKAIDKMNNISNYIYLAIAIVVLTLGLAFVCIRGTQMERKIKILEAEIDFLKLNEKIYEEHIDSIYKYLISVCDRLKNTNDYESDK